MINLNLLIPKWSGRYTSFGFEHISDGWNCILMEPKEITYLIIAHPEIVEGYVISLKAVAEYIKNKNQYV